MKTRPSDPAQYLDDDEAVAVYLTEALKTGEPAYVAHALRAIAETGVGLSEFAAQEARPRENRNDRTAATHAGARTGSVT